VLKKYQVLIPGWLEDYIKYLAERYDLSVSEIIRAEICFAIISQVSHFYPEYKPGISNIDLLDTFKNALGKDMEREEIHKILSTVYFETRKAVEYRLSRELPAEND
jgi:hypothetical protein